MRLKKTGSLDGVVAAVFYLWDGTSNLFPPEWSIDPEHSVSSDDIPKAAFIGYKSSGNSIKWGDFKEYEYKIFPKKGKYGDFDILDYFGDEAREIIGADPVDIEKISEYAIPTITTDNKLDKSPYWYFKSRVLTSGKSLTQFEAPEGCYKIELYDQEINFEGKGNCVGGIIADADYLGKTKDLEYIVEPIITIYLGPGKENILCPLRYYYDQDIDVDRVSMSTAKEYRKLVEEILFSKVVTLVSVSEDVESISINTSQTSFYDSKDPLKNLSKIALRNDEWWSSKGSINQVGIKGGSLYDLTSGTILGNKKLTNTPILDSKLELLQNLEFSYDHTYNKGELCEIGGLKYVSIVDSNRGNQPMVSPEWILEEDFTATFTKTINIFASPINSGVASKAYLVYDSGRSKSFEFTPGYGFEFKWDSKTGTLGGSKLTNGVVDLVEGVDYKYVEREDLETKKLTRSITILAWDKILETEKIVVCPVIKSRDCNIRLLYKNQYYYLDSNSTQRLKKNPDVAVGETYEYSDITLNGSLSGEIMNSLLATSTSTLIGVSGIGSKYYSVEGVKATYTYSDFTEKVVDLREKEEGVYEDTEISSKVIYTILVQDREYKCRVYFNTEEWEVEESCPVLYYNKPLIIRFYPISDIELRNVGIYNYVNGEWRLLMLFNPEEDSLHLFEVEDGIVTFKIPEVFTKEELKIFINVNEQ